MCAEIPVKPISVFSACFCSVFIGMPCILSLKYCVRWRLGTQIKQGRQTDSDINACDREIESSHVVNLTYSAIKG